MANVASEKLKQVPDQLEGLIGDKLFLPAALLLVASTKTIHKPEISQIGAISELKAYLASQESVRRWSLGSSLISDHDRYLDRRAAKSSVPQNLLQ